MRYVQNLESEETPDDLCVRIGDIEPNHEEDFVGTLSGSKCTRLQDVLMESSVGFEYKVSLRSDGETLFVKGRVTGILGFNCDRCLDPVKENTDEIFKLVLRPKYELPKAGEEKLLRLEEMQTDSYEGDWLDLADLIEEQVMLSVPAKILCDEECRGLCPECGMNWNKTTCHCTFGIADHPFAVLINPVIPLEKPDT